MISRRKWLCKKKVGYVYPRGVLEIPMKGKDGFVQVRRRCSCEKIINVTLPENWIIVTQVHF